MAQTLRLVEDLSTDVAETRVEVTEILELTRTQYRTVHDRVSALPLPPYLGAEIIDLDARVRQAADLAESHLLGLGVLLNVDQDAGHEGSAVFTLSRRRLR